MKNLIKQKHVILIISLVLIALIIIIVASLSGRKNRTDEKPDASPPEITFDNIPDVPSREDVNVTYSNKTIEDIYESNGIEYVYSAVVYPCFEGGNSDATSKINSAILAFASDRVTIKSYEKTNSEEAFQRAERNGMSFIEFEFITRIESVYVKNGYLSVMFKCVRTVGMTEPSENISAMCFDLMTGEEVDISAFMNIDTESARDFVFDVFSQHININKEHYYSDALDTLPDVIDLKYFYLTEDGLILFINPDTITPSVMGVTYFTVEYDKIGY